MRLGSFNIDGVLSNLIKKIFTKKDAIHKYGGLRKYKTEKT